MATYKDYTDEEKEWNDINCPKNIIEAVMSGELDPMADDFPRATKIVTKADGETFEFAGHSKFIREIEWKETEWYDDPRGFRDYDKKKTNVWKWGHNPKIRNALFKKGNKFGPGRVKGDKNKKTIRQELLDNGGLTPAQFLATVVNDESLNLNQRIRAAEAAAKFYDPTLAAVEMQIDDKKEAPFNIFLADALPEEVTDTFKSSLADKAEKIEMARIIETAEPDDEE